MLNSVFSIKKNGLYKKTGLKWHKDIFILGDYSFELLDLLNCCIANGWCCSCRLKIENERLPVTLSLQIAAGVNTPLAFYYKWPVMSSQRNSSCFLIHWDQKCATNCNLSSLALPHACTLTVPFALNSLMSLDATNDP